MPSDNKYKLILIGAISGLVSLFINYLFHSYIGSYEVKYTFWLLAALIFVLPRINAIEERAGVSFKFGRNFKFVAIFLPLLFGIVHLWNSTQGLSINNRTEKFGWIQNFGLYEEENDNRGFSFQWAKKSAGITVENVGSNLVIPLVASHPDLAKKPVKLRIFVANQYFRKKELYKEITFKSKEWRDLEVLIPNSWRERIYLVFETDRAWQPLKYLNVPDARTLAIGIGKPWFHYPHELPEAEIKSIEKIPSSNRGNPELASNDIREIKFKINEKNTALRLWVRGQKAFGIGPYIIIRLDNSLIGMTMLNEENWTPLIFTRDINMGEHTLSVEFTNDYYVPEKGQDRNVSLGELDIIYMKQK